MKGGTTNKVSKQSTLPSHLINVKSSDLEYWMLCKRFQKAAGCTENNSACPEGKLHRCTFLLSGGSYCGSGHHGKIKCKAETAQDGHWYSKGKGGKKGEEGKGKGANGKGEGKGKGY